MESSSSSARQPSRSTPATRSRTRTEQTTSTRSNTTTTTTTQRKPFSPLPLGLFPCKFDLHSGFSLRSTPCSPQVTSGLASTSTPASTSRLSEKMARCGKTKAVPGPSSSSTKKEGTKKAVVPPAPEHINKKQLVSAPVLATKSKTPAQLERMDVDPLPSRRAKAVNLDSDDEEEAAWEQQSPARRLFVGMGMMGSPSSSSKKTGQPKSKLSMMMMDDELDIATSYSVNLELSASASGSASTSTLRPTLRPSPKLTPKKTSTSAISIEKRTWTGRDSPSASPIMSKKVRSIGSIPVAATDIEMNAGDDVEEDEGDKTIMPREEPDSNADVHAVGFDVWSDQATNTTGTRRDVGYFDLGVDVAEVRKIPTAVATPKYTAENIKHVGKNKLPFPTTDEVNADDVIGKGQENVPPLGWIDLTALTGEKLKPVCTPSRGKFADQFATPGSGSSKHGTPSYGDPSSVSSLASTPATDRVRKTSTVSLGPSPVKASSIRGPTSTMTPSPTPPLTPEIEMPTPRARLGSGMKRSLTKSLLDLRDAAGLGGRVLRSGRGRDL